LEYAAILPVLQRLGDAYGFCSLHVYRVHMCPRQRRTYKRGALFDTREWPLYLSLSTLWPSMGVLQSIVGMRGSDMCGLLFDEKSEEFEHS